MPSGPALDSTAGSTTPYLSFYRQRLVSDVERNRRRFDPDTGRFLTDGGWAVTNQDIVYPLALLYLDSENPYHNDQSILDLVVRGGDAWRDFQNPDGTVEFVKVDGSRWGPIYMPWSMYFWLETYALLAEILDDERRQRWQDGLRLAYTGICATLHQQAVHNIPVWNAAAAYRAGEVFGEKSWQEAGLAMIRRAVTGQDPKGYWPEHQGPTPAYNYVYVQALGIYYAASGDPAVLPALEASAEFHSRYTYPDGRIVETIDGRVRYHDWVPVSGHVGFAMTHVGREYLRFLIQQTEADLDNRGVETESHYGLDRQYGSAFAYWRGHIGAGTGAAALESASSGVAADAPPMPAGGEPVGLLRISSGNGCIEDPGLAVVCRQEPWYYCLSEFLAPSGESRWGQDRQQFLSIYHHRFGLLCGGGNSKNQPEWSTFLLPPTVAATDAATAAKPRAAAAKSRTAGASSEAAVAPPGEPEAASYVPSFAALDTTDRGHRLRCVVGGGEFELRVSASSQVGGANDYGAYEGEHSLRDTRPAGSLVASFTGPAGGQARILLRLQQDMLIRLGTGAQIRVDASTTLHLGADELAVDGERRATVPGQSIPAHGELTLVDSGISIELPLSARLEWPVSPFNPYAKSGAAPADDSVAVLIIGLGRQSTRVTFTDTEITRSAGTDRGAPSGGPR